MKLDPPTPGDRGEPVAPMINVVFLLLIFFMMAATLSPPDPIETTPPVSSSDDDAELREALVVGPDGALAWGEARGEAVYAALKARIDADPAFSLAVRADASTPAKALAKALSRLKALGASRVTMAVESR